LKVAQLAGMPIAAMEIAKGTLSKLKNMKDDERDSSTQRSIVYAVFSQPKFAEKSS
jgi:hypothetical protein